MKTLSAVPRGLAEIKVAYGNPDADNNDFPDQRWERDNLVTAELPFPMRISYRPEKVVNLIRCHMRIVASLLDALAEVLDREGLESLQAKKWDRWGGCYCFRQMRGYDALSVHSWGCAVDICPDLGRYGNREDIATFPRVYVDVFTARGWDWGGGWSAKWSADAMHFQACRGY